MWLASRSHQRRRGGKYWPILHCDLVVLFHFKLSNGCYALQNEVMCSYVPFHSDLCCGMQAARATGCFAFSASVREPGGTVKLADGLLTCVSAGPMKTQGYLSMLDLAKKGCERVAAFAKLSLEKAFQGRD